MHPHFNQQASLERLEQHRHQAQLEQHLSSIRPQHNHRAAWHTVLAWLLHQCSPVIGGDARVTHPKR